MSNRREYYLFRQLKIPTLAYHILLLLLLLLLLLFSPNIGKYRPEITLHLGNFHAVIMKPYSQRNLDDKKRILGVDYLTSVELAKIHLEFWLVSLGSF